jgi:hypothetical protein
MHRHSKDITTVKYQSEARFNHMKKSISGILAMAMALSVAAGLSGCGTAGTSVTAKTVTAGTQAAAAAPSASQSAGSGIVKTTSVTTGNSGSMIDASSLFSDRDLQQTADTTGAMSYTVSDGKNITISKAGVYILSGTAKDCTITVNAAKQDDKIQLVLDGLNITNTDSPAIYVVSADKCFITTTANESSLTVTGAFKADGNTNTDAVIFSKDDLVLNGVGTLKVSSSENCITSKDDLKITGGTYQITAGKNGFEGKDSISICGGTFEINTVKDGFHSENKDDNTKGSIYISDGTFNIKAGDDGIQGTTITEIDGGNFTINSVEGIEGTYVQINNGTISINASDDGINAAQKSTAYDIVIELNGGNITIVMESGDTDAVDANGTIYVNGGNINITGSSSFDYDKAGYLNGGTVIVNGTQITEMPSGMNGRGGGMNGGKRGRF